MSTNARQTNIRGRLYELLPSIHQLKDERQGYPLKALLGVVGEQAEVLEDDIRQLYENWFIETCDDWVVPYIGDLIGYQQPSISGPPIEVRTDRERMRQRVLTPRREVGNTIRNRRRKGTLAILEELARDVADWPARAVEFYRLLCFTQSLNHQRSDRGRTVDFRDGPALERINSPFDQVAHTLDVRDVDRYVVAGRYGLFHVGLFVWRLNAYSLTKARAKSTWQLPKTEPHDRHLFSFDPLGSRSQLFTRSVPEQQPTDIAGELNLPVPILRHMLRENLRAYYGPDRSFQIWRSYPDVSGVLPIPLDQISIGDLSSGMVEEWRIDQGRQAIGHGHDPERIIYGLPKRGVAVDPETGRMAFPKDNVPDRVEVTYHYGFSADMGSGEYERTMHNLTDHTLLRVSGLKQLEDALKPYRDGGSQEHVDSIAPSVKGSDVASVEAGRTRAREVVIDITDSDTYIGLFDLTVPENLRLQIRASNGHRPTLLSSVEKKKGSDEKMPVLTVSLEPRSRFAVDGLVLTGLEIDHKPSKSDQPATASVQTLYEKPGVAALRPRVTIRHCTIPPTWRLQLSDTPAHVTIQHSIIAMIDVRKEERISEPLLLDMSDCILDPGTRDSAGHCGPTLVTRHHPSEAAHAVARIVRCTVLGSVEIHSLELAENSIFIEPVTVSRPEFGCMRFSYVDPRSPRTPKRYQCQPDLALRMPAACSDSGDSTTIEVEKERVKNYIRPRFTSAQFGAPGYCQLGPTCPPEITRGAEDESEMGVFHDLYQPQREQLLQQRLEEYVPAETEAGIIFAT